MICLKKRIQICRDSSALLYSFPFREPHVHPAERTSPEEAGKIEYSVAASKVSILGPLRHQASRGETCRNEAACIDDDQNSTRVEARRGDSINGTIVMQSKPCTCLWPIKELETLFLIPNSIHIKTRRFLHRLSPGYVVCLLPLCILSPLRPVVLVCGKRSGIESYIQIHCSQGGMRLHW